MKNLQNLKLFLYDPSTFLDTLDNQSSLHRMYIGPKPFVFVFSAQVAREILVKRSSLFGKSQSILKKIIPVTGKHGLVQLEGKISRQCRHQAREIFIHENLTKFQTLIEERAHEFIDALPQNEPINIAPAMTDLILSTAFRLFLELDLTCFSHEIGKQFLHLNQLCGQSMMALISMPDWFPSPRNLKIRRLRNQIRAFLAQCLKEKDHHETNVASVFAHDPHLIDQCMTFLFAGHETTASSLAFTFLLLAKYPQFQDAISNGDDHFTKAIYQESLRLFPPAFMVAKQALADTTLGSLPVKKNDQVIIGIKQMHKSERYFERPEQFIPERFLENRYYDAFIPFSIGQKSCIGESLAYREAIIILKILCKKFYIIPNTTPIECSQLITLHPKEHLTITLQKR